MQTKLLLFAISAFSDYAVTNIQLLACSLMGWFRRLLLVPTTRELCIFLPSTVVNAALIGKLGKVLSQTCCMTSSQNCF